jgi:hypothetical protein
MRDVGWLNPLIVLIVAALLDFLLLPALAGFIPAVVVTLLHVLLIIVMVVAVIFLILGLFRLVRS